MKTEHVRKVEFDYCLQNISAFKLLNTIPFPEEKKRKKIQNENYIYCSVSYFQVDILNSVFLFQLWTKYEIQGKRAA